MKITIVQTEIEDAIQDHLKKAINLPEGKGFHIDIIATRGVNGVTAEIEIIDTKQNQVKEEEPCWMPGGSDMNESVKEEQAPVEEQKVVSAVAETEASKKSFFDSFE